MGRDDGEEEEEEVNRTALGGCNDGALLSVCPWNNNYVIMSVLAVPPSAAPDTTCDLHPIIV